MAIPEAEWHSSLPEIKVGFHGSRKKFNRFSLSYFGQSDAGQWGEGIYFTDKEEIASQWGNYLYRCNLHFYSPFIIESGDMDKLNDFLDLGNTTKECTDKLKELGYDSIISEGETWYVDGKIIKGNQYVIFDPKNIEILSVTNLDDGGQPMEEAFETHDKLNPRLFDNSTRKMRREVRERLIEIADKFVDGLKEDGVPLKVYDYWVLGSNAAYNYTPKSDIDTHIIVNMEDVDVDPEVLTILYNYAKSKFNDDYDITIRGQEVELYIEDINTSAISNGVYSLKRDKWIKEPEPMKESSIDITNEDGYKEWDARFEEVINSDNIDDLQSFVDDIYILRKDSLAKDGEFGLGNLIFKEMRNQDKLQQVKDKIKEVESKELTLENLDSTSLHEKQEQTVYNAWHAWPQYRQKYGRVDSFFELQHSFHLTNDEMKWVLDKCIKYKFIDEYTKDYVIDYLKLDEALSGSSTSSKALPELRYKDHLSMENLMDEAVNRNVQPYDLFQPADDLVDANWFFKNTSLSTDSTSSADIERLILHNTKDLPFYAVLLHYLNNDDNYNKLEPAWVKRDRWSGKYIPVGGKYKAKLCSMLGIKLPVRVGGVVEEKLHEEAEGNSADIFDINHITIPYYDDLLKSQIARDRANIKVHIAQMSPREYFRECAKIFGSTFEAQIRQIRDDKESLQWMQDQLDKGVKLPITWLDYSSEKTQDGRHRMYAVGQAFGWDKKYPVIIFETADPEIEKQKLEQKRVDRISRAFYHIEPSLLRPSYEDINELKEQLEWLLDRYLDDVKVSIRKDNSSLILIVNEVEFTYNMNDFSWNDHTPNEDDFDYEDLEPLHEDASETGDTVIKAVLYRWKEPPKKPVADFKDFEEDGVYRLGDYDYIAFEKRWRDNPLGWGLIHQDIVDDLVKPLYDHYDQWNRYVGIEVDNLGPRIFMYDDVQDSRLGQFAKYGSILRRAVRKYFE